MRSAGLIAFMVVMAGCSVEQPSVRAPCEFREIARACGVEAGERSISVFQTSARQSCFIRPGVDGVTVSIPFQPLRILGDAYIKSGEKRDEAEGYDRYLISLLPSDPVRDEEMPEVLYAYAKLCRAVTSWRDYAVVVTWRDVNSAPSDIVRSALGSLDAWSAQCRKGSK